MDATAEVAREYRSDLRTVLGATLRAKPHAWRLLNADGRSVRCLVLADGPGLRAGQRVYVALSALETGTVVRIDGAGDELDAPARHELRLFLDQVALELAGGSEGVLGG